MTTAVIGRQELQNQSLLVR